MKPTRITSALFAATVLLATACGGGDDTATTDTAAPVASVANGEEGGLQSFAVEGEGDGGAAVDATTTTAAAPETTAEETTTTTEATTTTTEDDRSGDVDVFSFQVGDCFSDAGGDSVESLPLVPCTEEHTVEVYALYDLPDGEFPGTDEVSDLSSEGCLDRFEDYVGTAYADSAYDINTIFPTVQTWDVLDDREVICLLIRIDGQPNIGSGENSGI